MSCECEWPNRRWNPASGLCESCRCRYEPDMSRVTDPRDAEITRLTAERDAALRVVEAVKNYASSHGLPTLYAILSGRGSVTK